METISWVALGLICISLAISVTKKIPAAGSLMIANVVVFGITAFGPTKGDGSSVIHYDLGLHADWLAAGEPLAFLQLFSSMFVHADFYHLVGNLIVLFAFAFPFEERIGPKKFLSIYLATGLIATLVQIGFTWGEQYVLMGASGAVFGIIGAFAGAYPSLVLPLPLPLLIIMIFVRMRVIIAAAVFALMQFLSLQFLSSYDNTAYWAHLGGLGAGLALAFAVKPRVETRYYANFVDLKAYATSPRAVHALSKMNENRDLQEVYLVWAQKFVEHARNEKGERLELRNGEIHPLRS